MKITYSSFAAYQLSEYRLNYTYTPRDIEVAVAGSPISQDLMLCLVCGEN